MNRIQRRSKTQYFDFSSNLQDSMSYEPNGSTFSIGLFPGFETKGYPDLPKVEFKVRAGKSAPEKSVLDRVFRTRLEVENETLIIYGVIFRGGILPELEEDEAPGDIQTACILLKPSGEVIRIVQTRYVRDSESVSIDYVLNLMEFEKHKKRISESDIKTVIHAIDEETLTHEYTLAITAPGMKYERRAAVSELKKSGVFGIGGKYFKNAHFWPTGSGAALIFEDGKGALFVSAKTPSGKVLPAHPAKSLSYALSFAKHHANNG